MNRPARTAAWMAALVLTAPLVSCSDPEDKSSPDSENSAEASPPLSTQAQPQPTGRIVFQRENPARGFAEIYTANPDGTGVEELFAQESMAPGWSPDGTEIALFCCDDGQAAHIIDAETGELRTLPPQDPGLETYCKGPWTPNGKRLTCETFGAKDRDRNGIYTIRASDGGGLKQITSIHGGTDIPGDYSPDGKQLVFVRFINANIEENDPLGIFVTNVEGTGLRRVTPKGMIIDDTGYAGSWSPDGDKILLVARTAEENHKAIYVVDARGGSPEQLPITPACGGPSSEAGQYGCYSPSWSPDGKKIVFTRSDGTIESIYAVNADGSGLAQVTDGEDDAPDWGPTPTS